jgi:alginate O-acetyltransferase complex protein AlgI
MMGRLDISYRNRFLLLMSLFFYFWGEPIHIAVMIASIILNYYWGIAIDNAKNSGKNNQKLFLICAISSNLIIFMIFKYIHFIIDIINSILYLNISHPKIYLPIGISFFTFQGLTYIIDLYRGEVAVQRNFCKVALYISLFPQLVAGPIVRYKDIENQISSRKENIDLFYSGVVRFILGLSKKVLIANQVAVVADKIFFLQPNHISIPLAWLGVFCYSIQIYFDFSGYSDMAIGLGRMFGFRFKENFNYPYISNNIIEFWRRWHISMSSFFRDYVYIPLGGSRKGNICKNLLITFFVTGLWHGAGWTFIIWGFWHGLFIIIEHKLKFKYYNFQNLFLRFLSHIYVLFVIMVGWVLFRAENISYAIDYLGVLFGIVNSTPVGYTFLLFFKMPFVIYLIFAILFAIPIMPKLAIFLERSSLYNNHLICNLFFSCKTIILTILLLLSLFEIISSSYNPFIYFRF